jgi:iron complex outermembrane receptor protein
MIRTRCAVYSALAFFVFQGGMIAVEPVSAAETAPVQLNFDIPAQSLPAALNAFAARTGIDVVFKDDIDPDVLSKGVKGELPPNVALQRLLMGTPYAYRFLNPTEVAIERRATDAQTLDTIDVVATRGLSTFETSPAASTIVSRETIQQQSTLSSDLGAILSQQVPGLGPTTHSLTTVAQTLRGREPMVLIDGVPQSLPLRDGKHALRNIDPSAIERVEVLRGATGVYGFGGAGGVINIITKRPEKGETRYSTEVVLGASTEHFDDSLRSKLVQSVEGGEGRFDYLGVASVENTEGFFDANGERIPPDPQGQGGLADSRAYDLLAKIGFEPDKLQRYQISVNYYEIKQDTDFISVPGNVATGQPTQAVRGDTPGLPTGTENLQATFEYRHANVLGSKVQAQLYYRDFMTRWRYFDAPVYVTGGQSFIDSQRLGSRLDITTPHELFQGGQFIWGVDLLHEKTAQFLVDGRTFAPEMVQDSVGPFVQGEFFLSDSLTLNAGARYEHFWLDVDDFTTFGGDAIEGGELTYDDLVFNIGAIWDVSPSWTAIANFSQGFTVPEAGRAFRNAQTGDSVTSLRPEPQRVDNYELGLRYYGDRWEATGTLFYSESELGTSFNDAGSLVALEVVRAPERIYGIELTADASLSDTLRAGSTFTWLEGKHDADNDGQIDDYLPGNRIPPLKLTAYFEHQTAPNWLNRLQAEYIGSRDRFDAVNRFGLGKVDSYTVLDLVSTYQLEVGTLRFAVANLLNEDYFPLISQIYNLNSHYSKAPGRTVSLSYRVSY